MHFCNLRGLHVIWHDKISLCLPETSDARNTMETLKILEKAAGHNMVYIPNIVNVDLKLLILAGYGRSGRVDPSRWM